MAAKEKAAVTAVPDTNTTDQSSMMANIQKILASSSGVTVVDTAAMEKQANDTHLLANAVTDQITQANAASKKLSEEIAASQKETTALCSAVTATLASQKEADEAWINRDNAIGFGLGVGITLVTGALVNHLVSSDEPEAELLTAE